MIKKFYESYKSFDNNENYNQNYLDTLSSSLIRLLSEMKNINIEYDKIIKLANDDEKEIIGYGFNYLKIDLLWNKFCNLMRDYSDILYGLLNKKENGKIIKVENYLKIQEYIDSTKFISAFMGSEAFNALSLTLHNFNEHYYGKEKFNKSFSKYPEFNTAINCDISIIGKEFQEIINLFRCYHNYGSCVILSNFGNYYPLYYIFDFLLNKLK